MIAAAHLNNFLFLLFIAVAIFFQLLTRVASKSGRRSGDRTDRRQTSSPPLPRSAREQSDETEEDRVRKFLEALGQPTASPPPPPVVRRPTYQEPVVLPKRVFRDPFQLPPLTTRPPDLPLVEVSDRPPPPLAPVTEVETPLPAPTGTPVSKPAESKIDLARFLRTSSGLRDAMILREIFGPPRSMQALDFIGNV